MAMSERGRAYRRWRDELARRRTMRIILLMYPEIDRAEAEETMRRMYKNRKRCSCWMCGNQRRYWGPTPQERMSQPTPTT